MSLVINTNLSATLASVNLQSSNSQLQKSLARLSSGSKIVQPSDDAGGLAVSMKLSSAITRTDAVLNNVSNAVSFLQTQDGAMSTAGKILDRISELRTLFDDITKSSSDKSNYDAEFIDLQTQMVSLESEKFNGINMFSSANMSVITTEDGTGAVDVGRGNLTTAFGAIVDTSSTTSLSDLGISHITSALQNVATLRAANGAQSSRLEFAAEMLTVNRTNLEAANSRIIDTDIAEESTRFARFNILVQSGTAMLAQANQSKEAVLRLLQ